MGAYTLFTTYLLVSNIILIKLFNPPFKKSCINNHGTNPGLLENPWTGRANPVPAPQHRNGLHGPTIRTHRIRSKLQSRTVDVRKGDPRPSVPQSALLHRRGPQD